MGEVMKEASFSLAEAKFTVGSDFNAIVLQNVTKAQIKVIFTLIVFTFISLINVLMNILLG
jgi:hypothetical protein